MNNLVLDWVTSILNNQYKAIIIELTPTSILDTDYTVDVETGVSYKLFHNTNYVSMEGLMFDGYSITPNSLEYADSLFSNLRFSDNHIIINENYLNMTKIEKECLNKASVINAKFFAVYKVANDNSEEVTYGSITTSNSDK